MRIITAAALLAGVALTAGCTSYSDGPSRGYGYASYDWNRPDPSYGHYYADRYYRSGSRYHEYRLSADDRVYRGSDGRYYCRRSDGTTGLIVGGLAGAGLGAALTEGDSQPLGVILGAIAGGAAGAAIDQNNVRCR